MEKNKNYDLAFLGISHARNFSRYRNHERLERFLNKKILNLGQGASSCGANEQLFYLKYAYNNRKIKIDTLIYVLSPPLLFSNELNITSSTFDSEVFELSFLFEYMNHQSENKSERIFHYIKSKFSPDWILLHPTKRNKNEIFLEEIDSAAVREGFKLAYPNGLQDEVFNKSSKAIEQTVNLAKKNNSFVIFIIPPALFRKWEGHEKTFEFCKEMKNNYGCDCFDLSETMLEPIHYYDHHHLNSDGVDIFAREHLIHLLK
jgi:hypothetical protein